MSKENNEALKNIKPSKKSFKNFELEMETRTLNAHFEMKEIYEYALKKNKKIIITSDMYMRREFLEKILIKNGFEGFSKLYVSGEVQKTKGSGNLFDFIIEDLKIKPNKLLHIGDNEYSDYKVPTYIKNGLVWLDAQSKIAESSHAFTKMKRIKNKG